MTETAPVIVDIGLRDLRIGLTDAVDLARHGTVVRVESHKRVMCYLVPPALAEKCLKIERAEQE
jgi:hypothetical protein